MPRVKRGTNRRDSRRKTLDRASGFFLTKSKLNRAAQEAVEKRQGGAQPRLRPAYSDLEVAQAEKKASQGRVEIGRASCRERV